MSIFRFRFELITLHSFEQLARACPGAFGLPLAHWNLRADHLRMAPHSGAHRTS